MRIEIPDEIILVLIAAVLIVFGVTKLNSCEVLKLKHKHKLELIKKEKSESE